MPIKVNLGPVNRTAPPPGQSSLPPLTTFGDLFPSKFTHWRGDQPNAITSTVDSAKRFIAQAAPTGFGKSLMYIAVAQLTGLRTAILTSTKGLQEQLLSDFNGDRVDRLVDIRGQNAYRCVRARDFDFAESTTCDFAPCHAGRYCSSKDGGCLYFDQYRKASSAPVVITNYAYWLSINKYGKGLGDFGLLVLDEAHDAPDTLAEFMSIEISPSELPMGVKIMDAGADIEQWREWAGYNFGQLQIRYDQLQIRLKSASSISASMMRESRGLKKLLGKLDALKASADDWVIEKVDSRKTKGAYLMRFDPVWPWKAAEALLFRGIPKVMLVSATLRHKTCDLLGIPPADLDFHEYNSTFAISRRPVIHVPTMQMNHRTAGDISTWLTRIDQIIGARLDRKGIIHTVSFARAKAIMAHSEYAQYMLFNDSATTKFTVDRFKRASAPCILVSPSVTTGYDFPYDECRYQIIGKLPFPDNRAKVIKARIAQDKDYSNYTAMQVLIQTAGRGMRAEDDFCETLVIDDNITWFMRNYKQFAPKWFRDAVSEASYVPPPPQFSSR